MGGVGMLGIPTYMHTHVHAHTHVYMYRNCKWPPTWRHPCLSCLTYIWVCVCMRACMHVIVCMVHGASLQIPTPTPNPIHPPANAQGGPPGISQNSITLELIKIIQFCLTDSSRPNSGRLRS